jgi:hypothetical protein
MKPGDQVLYIEASECFEEIAKGLKESGTESRDLENSTPKSSVEQLITALEDLWWVAATDTVGIARAREGADALLRSYGRPVPEPQNLGYCY